MKILFAADLSFSRISYPGDAAARAAMREPAALFASADFSILNLENIFGVAEDEEPIVKNGPNLISSPDFAEYIRVLNPTAVGLANNHTKDFGERPMLATKALLEREGYACIGAGRNLDEAYRPALFEKDGVTVAVLAVCENEFGGATDKDSGTAVYRLGRVSRFIADAKEAGQYPIVYFHAGHETYPFPSPARAELFRHFVDMGAVAVICSHTHCPQGYETYRGAPIVYNMGNFFFPMGGNGFSWGERDRAWFYGYMSELALCDGACSLTVHPYRFDDDGITMLTGEEKAKFDAYMDYINAPIADDARLSALFDSWCLIPSRFGYYRSLSTFDMEWLADGNRRTVTDLKNVFGCEAHNELVKNMLAMIYDERVEAARDGVDVILKLQNMELPEE
ncbi:MAG: CapA family protein [Clostridia bacterium]|nr:CapA family protein [Clostridia bacterium]